jgi:hypothetical protein
MTAILSRRKSSPLMIRHPIQAYFPAMANWKCKLFGHKLKDISGDGPLGSDGQGFSGRNAGVCEREGSIHRIDQTKPMWWYRIHGA